MRYGVREICDVVFKAKSKMTFGKVELQAGMPVFYFDSLKTSSLEGQVSTVYAQGGRGNPRLIAWDGDRTTTFTMEDALISPRSFAILSGAGYMDAGDGDDEKIYVHATEQLEISGYTSPTYTKAESLTAFADNVTYYTKNDSGAYTAVAENAAFASDTDYYTLGPASIKIKPTKTISTNEDADIYAMVMKDGAIDFEKAPIKIIIGNTLTGDVNATYDTTTTPPVLTITSSKVESLGDGDIIYLDYYTEKTTGVKQIEIEASKFGGSYYVEAQTLFRDQNTGADYPAEFIMPNCKVQSNFTFTMAPTGDPSTFTFTLDVMPDYTKFNKTKKVLAALQIIEDSTAAE